MQMIINIINIVRTEPVRQTEYASTKKSNHNC
ncbi:hypothetical protein D917_00916 [Trichinella nativa]|uniref:Uncharacterized protein n=1 Tax=Trichinella nativa TaxID=6335 RepID=A0A1Y3EXT5_9BILA|nr:hypothetical protein D917_00916 [Trichinella nativa]